MRYADMLNAPLRVLDDLLIIEIFIKRFIFYDLIDLNVMVLPLPGSIFVLILFIASQITCNLVGLWRCHLSLHIADDRTT